MAAAAATASCTVEAAGLPAKTEIQTARPHRSSRSGARHAQSQPGPTPTEIAKVSRSTVVHAREALDAEARKAARKAARETSKPAKSTERRQRAQQFLREQLARGPKQASVVEDAAAKAHVDPQALEQARGDLGIVTSRANAGGVMAVQWSLPG
jgi:hypothetical protein